MTVQRETVKIKYGKTLNMGDYNSVVMHIEETYLVPDDDFDSKKFILMKAQEFEDIIDEKHPPHGTAATSLPSVDETVKKYIDEKTPEKEPEFRIDKKGQEKYKCPRCEKMDRLKQYDFCYSCNLEL